MMWMNSDIKKVDKTQLTVANHCQPPNVNFQFMY